MPEHNTHQHANTELVEHTQEFLQRYYSDDIAELARKYPRDQKSLYVDWEELFQFDPDLADDFLNHPDDVRDAMEEALRLYDLPVDISLGQAHVRVYNVDQDLSVDEVSRHENIGSLIGVRGQVGKVSGVKPRLEHAVFVCQRCGAETEMPQYGEEIREPHQCESCERQGPFKLDPERSDFVDHQFARLQQPPETAKGGSGEHIDVHLEDDLIKEFKAGDRVTLTGTLETEDLESADSRNFDTNIDADAVVREESDYEDIEIEEHLDEISKIASGERGDPYELLVDSINPKHRGDRDIKLAVALQLFGGWAHEYPDGSRDRGDFHVLLLGDPGCGKSTFLRYVDEIAPRSTYASGKGATAAGMTAAAVSDDFGDTEWGLEAGALVLADGGIASVDEIDKMQSDAVSSMHDALESQRVHVNKAGINATLNARTSLLAAGNPKHGRFDQYEPIADQIGLGPTLLSRFDLMFMVNDQPNPEKDAEVVNHMVESRQAAAKYTRGEELTEEDEQRIEPAIDRDVMRAYIAYAKEECYPYFKDESVKRKLSEFFVGFRNSGDDESPVPVTFRSVEGIQRLAEASARVRLSDAIELQDVERAIDLVTSSMKQVGYDPEAGEFDADIVETGQSKSQRDRRTAIMDLVKELGGTTRAEVLDRLDDFEKKKVEHDIDKLLKRGDLTERSSGVLRTNS